MSAYMQQDARYAIALNPIYEGVTVTQVVVGSGQITFNPNVKEKYYKNYFNLGMKNIFDIYDFEEQRYMEHHEKEKIKL